jgi:hypothetical protein
MHNSKNFLFLKGNVSNRIMFQSEYFSMANFVGLWKIFII